MKKRLCKSVPNKLVSVSENADVSNVQMEVDCTGFTQTFFSAYFRLSPLLKPVRKVVGSFGKKHCVNTGVRKPGNACVSPTSMIQS